MLSLRTARVSYIAALSSLVAAVVALLPAALQAQPLAWGAPDVPGMKSIAARTTYYAGAVYPCQGYDYTHFENEDEAIAHYLA